MWNTPTGREASAYRAHKRRSRSSRRFAEKKVPRSSGSRGVAVLLSRWLGPVTMQLAQNIVPSSWPCEKMAEVGAEWCRGLLTEGKLGLGVHWQAGARERTDTTTS